MTLTAAAATEQPVIAMPRQMYRVKLQRLSSESAGNERADTLENMAWWADEIANSADLTTQGLELIAEKAKWTFTALVCRAVAATERGYILVDPEGAVKWLAASDWAWEALIQHAGQHLQRAEILHQLYEQIADDRKDSTALVLDDIAATEMNVAEVLAR